MPSDFTPCPFCALQCGVAIKGDSSAVRIVGNPNDPINEGHLCQKGLASLDILHHRQRQFHPLAREGRSEPLTPVLWSTAFDMTAARIRDVQRKWGADSMAIYGSGALTNETAYLLGKFARLALGTREIDYNGRFCMSSAAKAYVTMFGLDRPTATFEDVRQAETLLFVGSNLSEAHPMAMRAVKQAKRRGATIIVVDPRRTPLAKAAQYHLPIRPGTDGFLAWALLHTIIEGNLTNEAFIAAKTQGFDDVRFQARHYTPAVVSLLTDIAPDIIESVARIFARSPRAMVLHGRGIEQYRYGVESVSAFLNVVLATGQIGRPGTGAIMLTGQANGQGGRELGQKTDQLPGSRSITSATDREHIARVWGIETARIPGPGRFTAGEFFSAINRGQIKGLMVVGANPLLSAPDTPAVQSALENLEFLAVLDPILTETAEAADIVLPTGGFGINQGTVTTVEARIVAVRPLSSPDRTSPGYQDWQVLKELANRLGADRYFPYRSSREIFEEMILATKNSASDYSGTSWSALMAGAMPHWPVPENRRQGTPRLYENGFATPDGKARFSILLPGPATELPTPGCPFHLITGRTATHYNSGAQTRHIPGLNRPADVVFIHHHTAGQLGIRDGEPLTITNATDRRLTLKARVTRDIRPDTVFVSMHNALDSAVNHFIPASPLGLSGMPEFKHTVVALSPVTPNDAAHEETDNSRTVDTRRSIIAP